MRTWTQFQNDYYKITNNNTTANQTLGATYLNDSIRTICNIQGGKLRFLESTKTMLTVANQEAYQTPNGFRKIIDMYFTVGGAPTTSTIYTPEMVFDPTVWKRIKQARLGTSNVPYFTYVESQRFLVQPIPSTSGSVITIRGRLRQKDLSIADYTTGSIVSIANGATTLTGTGTTWTQDMVGRSIRITETTASNGGDGFWYEIGSYTNATTLELLKPYEGTSIVAGTAAYVLGQTSLIPEAYDIAVVYRAVALYYQQKGDLEREKSNWIKYDGGVEAGYSKDYGGIILQMLENEGETEEGSYLPPVGSATDPMQAPYYFPYQDASGFA